MPQVTTPTRLAPTVSAISSVVLGRSVPKSALPDEDPARAPMDAEDRPEREPGEDLAAQRPATSRARRTSPSAIARMTSVEACEPALPPLEMMSGMNSARTTACAISSSKSPIAVAVSISPTKRSASQPRALADHLARGRSGGTARRGPPCRRSSGCPRSPPRWTTSTTSSTVTMPFIRPSRVDDRDGVAVVLGAMMRATASWSSVVGHASPRRLHDVGDAAVGRRGEEVAERHDAERAAAPGRARTRSRWSRPARAPGGAGSGSPRRRSSRAAGARSAGS